MALLAFALVTIGPAAAADPPKRTIDLHTDRLGVLGLPLAEGGGRPAYRVALTGEIDGKGEGRGTLVLDLSDPPGYDEFGFVTKVAPAREVRLDCSIQFVKTMIKVYNTRVGGPGSDKYKEEREEWQLYSLTGPKVASRLFLALPPESPWPRGRLLVQDKPGVVKYAIELMLPPQPEPCHPGCFPAGTLVRVPGGTALIESVRQGDLVATVAADGKAGTAAVETVFVTRNRLLEVRTDDGTLTTTETQPLALEAGGFRAAGDLKAGDRVWRWAGAERRATTVLGVSAATREAQVFNLVLGTPTTFVAGDFLVRSKPPADAVRP